MPAVSTSAPPGIHSTPTSDLQHAALRVRQEFRPEERVGFFRLADIEEELTELLGGRKVDLRTPMDLSRYFRDEVGRDAPVVYAES